jgi:hypothetical protein
VEKRRVGLRKKKKGIYASKMKRATHMLFFRRHQKPGVKGWELQRALGADYPKVLEVLNDFLMSLDLQVKTVYEEEKTPDGKPTLEELNRARFYVTLRGELTPKESKMIGWRIDDLAGLAVAISYIISKKGQDDENDQLYLNWRTRAEVDEKALIDLLLRSEVQATLPYEAANGGKDITHE